MHNSKAPLNVGQKSAQAGFTETLLNRVFYYIDVKAQSVLYVLPNKNPDATDFTATRFNPALEASPYLSRLFSHVNNVGVKRAGSAALYVRGSRSRSALKSIPVGLVILDEVDEMTWENIPLAFERMSGQMEKEAWMVSTPTIDGQGINYYYRNTTQEHFHFKCPGCSRLTELTFPECLEITGEGINDPNLENSYIKCRECKVTLPHDTKGDWLNNGCLWVPTYPDRINRGFHINQLYSSTVHPKDIAVKALAAETNAADEQELYNSKLGLTHTTAGAQITDEQINSCKKPHRQNHGLTPINWDQLQNDLNFDSTNCIITIGIDVGKMFHFSIEAWKRYAAPGRTPDPSLNAHPILLKADKCRDIDELYPLIDFFQPNMMVIDAGPERRLSYNFCLRYSGKAKMCQYIEGISGRHFAERSETDQDVIDEPMVSVDRTSWLDLSLGRFKGQGIHLPQNIQQEYIDNIKALVRMPKKQKDGGVCFRYEHEDGVADHFAHTRNYSEIAYPLAASGGDYEVIAAY